MDTELVRQAQRGDREAFASLAVAVGDRLHAVAQRILRDTDLAEDATQQALLGIWRDLPQLRDPTHFDAWSYRILVRACYAEGRRTRQWIPNLRLLPTDERSRGKGSIRSSIATSSSAASAGFPSNIARLWCCTTTSTCRSTRSPRPSASRSGRFRSRLHHAMRGLRAALEADARPAVGRQPNDNRPRDHAHRPVVDPARRGPDARARARRRPRRAPRDPTAPLHVAGVEVSSSCQTSLGSSFRLRRSSCWPLVGLQLLPASGIGGPVATASLTPSPSPTAITPLFTDPAQFRRRAAAPGRHPTASPHQPGRRSRSPFPLHGRQRRSAGTRAVFERTQPANFAAVDLRSTASATYSPIRVLRASELRRHRRR